MNTVEINLAALVANYRTLQGVVGESVRVMAVVKADAYGHGLIESAQSLAAAGAGTFGVAEVDEGIRLRQAGISGEILLLLGLVPEAVDEIVRYGLTPVVVGPEYLAPLAAKAGQAGRRVGLHVKVDLGMGRLGVMPEDLDDLLAEVERYPELTLTGLMSHFPVADDRNSGKTPAQLDAFAAILRRVNRSGSPGVINHIANSAAIMYHPASRLNMVRPGISLYGCYPDGPPADRAELRLEPVMRFTSRVIQIKQVPAGFGVSYGHTFVTGRPTRLAILPVGYADGYLRRLSNRARVLIKGRRVPVRGRVCMNATAVDVTDLEEPVTLGEEVVLMGRQEEGQITADEVAGWLETINYEVLCLFGSRNRRVFITPETG